MAGAPGATENNVAQCSALLQGTLGLRNCQEEPGRRKGLLRFSDKLPRAGKKRGRPQGRGRAGDPLGEQATGCCSLSPRASPGLAQAHPQTLELAPRSEHQVPVAGSEKVGKKQLEPGRKVQLGRRLHPAA